MILIMQIYDTIVIYTKNNQISITIDGNSEFKELKSYLLYKTDINLIKLKNA
ncbi:Uncharacterised protein [Campylobacter geochelonis]|uniref:Uncharacterized protein n=1 Tax=Campylobacter geochelonis TaxID=1780362 RepID=A0A128EHD6_9BACT|nr:Uncharacterised protein [Campylobacter geochelonis]